MKKQLVMLMAAGALAFTACSEDAGTSTETQDNDSQTPDSEAGEANDSSMVFRQERESRKRVDRVASQISEDLRLDAATQARVRTVLYNRARQVNELETRFSSTNQSAGLAADSGSIMSTDMMVNENRMMDSGAAVQANIPSKAASSSGEYPTRFYSEIESINSNVDLEVKGFLTPEQFKRYEANRHKYYGQGLKHKNQDGAKLKIDGEEVKVKTDDLRSKKQGDESRIKTDNV